MKQNLKNQLLGLATMLLLSLGGSACLVGAVSENDNDSKAVYKAQVGGTGANGSASSASTCAQATFRVAVNPMLVGNCGSCHSDSHGSQNLNIAYPATKGKSNLANPAGSRIVTYAGTVGHCGGCGSGLASAVTNGIAIWAKAEANDAATCAEYVTAVPTGGSSTTKPFDLGSYTPPNPNDTVIVQDGFNEFAATGGVYSLLTTQCRSCHVPGGLSANAPFGTPDPLTSYREGKPRANFANVDASLLLVKSGVKNHGGGCGICGGLAGDATAAQKSFYANLKTELTQWAAKENAAVQAAHVKLATNKPIYFDQINADTAVATAKKVTLSWNLDDTTPKQNDLAPAIFSIDVNLSNATTFRFSNPKIITGNRAIRVKKLTIYLNDKARTEIASYFFVDFSIPIGTTKTLATSPSLVAITAADTLTVGGRQYQNLKFDFEILQSE